MNRPPAPASPDDFAAEMMAYAIRWWRESVARMSLRQAGMRIPLSHSYLSKLERNRRPLTADLVSQLDRAYRAEGKITEFYCLITKFDHASRCTLAVSPSQAEEDETERRRLLQLAATGMGVGAFIAPDESVRRLVDIALNTAPRSVEDWELVRDDHLHAIRTRPAADVRDDLLVDLLRIHRELLHVDEGERTELYRIAAVLAAFHASVLTRLGERGGALRWYQTARAAADSSGDRDLRLLIRGHEADHSLYGLRSPEAVLRLTQDALRIAGSSPRPSVGLVFVTRAQAHALALTNRRAEARKAVQRFTDIAEANFPVVPGFWESSDYRIYFTHSQVFSAIGDETAAAKAQESILKGDPAGYQVPINARLHAAQCTVVNGGIGEGVRQATEVLAAIPRPYCNLMITETARRILRAVPVHQRNHPAVADLHAVLPITTAKDIDV